MSIDSGIVLGDVPTFGDYGLNTAIKQDRESTFQQLEVFNSILPDVGSIIRHAANSAATIDLPETCRDG